MLPAYFTLFVCVFASVCYMYHVNWSIITKWCTSAQAVQAPDQVLLAMVDSGQAFGENFSVHLLRVEKKIVQDIIEIFFAWYGQWTSLWRKIRDEEWERLCGLHMSMKQQPGQAPVPRGEKLEMP